MQRWNGVHRSLSPPPDVHGGVETIPGCATEKDNAAHRDAAGSACGLEPGAVDPVENRLILGRGLRLEPDAAGVGLDGRVVLGLGLLGGLPGRLAEEEAVGGAGRGSTTRRRRAEVGADRLGRPRAVLAGGDHLQDRVRAVAAHAVLAVLAERVEDRQDLGLEVGQVEPVGRRRRAARPPARGQQRGGDLLLTRVVVDPRSASRRPPRPPGWPRGRAGPGSLERLLADAAVLVDQGVADRRRPGGGRPRTHPWRRSAARAGAIRCVGEGSSRALRRADSATLTLAARASRIAATRTSTSGSARRLEHDVLGPGASARSWGTTQSLERGRADHGAVAAPGVSLDRRRAIGRRRVGPIRAEHVQRRGLGLRGRVRQECRRPGRAVADRPRPGLTCRAGTPWPSSRPSSRTDRRRRRPCRADDRRRRRRVEVAPQGHERLEGQAADRRVGVVHPGDQGLGDARQRLAVEEHRLDVVADPAVRHRRPLAELGHRQQDPLALERVATLQRRRRTSSPRRSTVACCASVTRLAASSVGQRRDPVLVQIADVLIADDVERLDQVAAHPGVRRLGRARRSGGPRSGSAERASALPVPPPPESLDRLHLRRPGRDRRAGPAAHRRAGAPARGRGSGSAKTRVAPRRMRSLPDFSVSISYLLDTGSFEVP